MKKKVFLGVIKNIDFLFLILGLFLKIFSKKSFLNFKQIYFYFYFLFFFWKIKTKYI